MPNFAYTALDATGNTVRGNLAVRSKTEAYRELEKNSLHPVSVREDSGATTKSGSRTRVGSASADESALPPPRLKKAQLILFTEELADLLDAGMQLEQALRIMHERQQHPDVRRVSARLRDEIREGARFSAALKKASPSFDDLYVNLVGAGEASGTLPVILRRLSDNIALMTELQSRVVSAMIYPAALVLACIGLLFVASTVMIPKLSAMIAKTSRELPITMELLIGFSDFMSKWWWVILISAVAAFLLFRAWIASEAGRKWWDQYKLNAPLFGAVMSARFYTQLTQSLGDLVTNGVPLLTGLKLLTKATSNVFLRTNLQKAAVMVAEGTALSSAMRKVGHFPSMLIDMIAVGEQTGQIGKSLKKAGVRYDRELTRRIDRVIKLISPVVLIFMAVVVGVVAFGIVSTLLQSVSSIRSRV